MEPRTFQDTGQPECLSEEVAFDAIHIRMDLLSCIWVKKGHKPSQWIFFVGGAHKSSSTKAPAALMERESKHTCCSSHQLTGIRFDMSSSKKSMRIFRRALDASRLQAVTKALLGKRDPAWHVLAGRVQDVVKPTFCAPKETLLP